MKKEVLRMEHIVKWKDGTKVLYDFHLKISEGEIVGLLGLSGSGKSNVCRLLAGLEVPDGGRILVRESEVPARPNANRGYEGVHCMHQAITLVPGLTVAENIVLMNGKILDHFMVNQNKINQRAKEVLARIGLADISPADAVSSLTVAQQRLVEIAKAVANGAMLIVMDAFAGAFTAPEREKMHKTMALLQKQGISFLVASHEPGELLALANQLIILREGKVIKTISHEDFDFPVIFSLLTGAEIESAALERKEISKGRIVFEMVRASLKDVNELSFTLHEGEILGLLDVDNRMNRRLYDLFTGKARFRGGGMFLENKHIEPLTPNKAVRLGIGLMDQDSLSFGILPNLNFEENLSLMIMRKCTNAMGVLSHKTLRFLEEQYWKRLHLPEEMKREPVKNFDVHTQQLILMMRHLVYQPKLLVCFNPCMMMDVVTRLLSYELINEIAANGTAVLVLSSDIKEVSSLSSRLIVCANGEARAVLNRGELEGLRLHDIY